MLIRRRTFIKSLGVTAVGYMVFNPAIKAFATFNKKTVAGQWIPSTCHGCTSWCPIEVFVQKEGAISRAVKVRGNQQSICNPGTLCPKGHLTPTEGYDPDRLKVPMKRTNSTKGRGVNPNFVPITWAEAIDTLADKMLALRNADEAHKFLFMRGRYTFTTDLIYKALPSIYGSPNSISHSSICAEAEKFGSGVLENLWGYRDYDMEKTKYMLLWGVDPFRSNRQPPRAMKVWQTVRKNAKVVVIDPLMTGAAAKANKWLPVIPGEDGALASAFAHHILVKGLWHKPFVGDFKDGTNLFVAGQTVDETKFTEIYTNGLVKWWNAALKDATPAWAAPITGISKADIEKIAQEMGAKAPNVISWVGPGPVMSPRGAYTSMALHALNGLLGSTRNVGGPMVQASKSANSLPDPNPYKDAKANTGGKKPKIDRRDTFAYPTISTTFGNGSIMNTIADGVNNWQAIADADALKGNITGYESPYDIKAALVYYNNTPYSATGAKRWEDAFTKIPFLCHITTHASEVSQFADILMPAAFSTEKWGLLGTSANMFTELTLMQPVATRLFDVKDEETEIPWLLAKALNDKGFTKLYEYYSTKFPNPESTTVLPTNDVEFGEFVARHFAYPAYSGQGDTWATFKMKGVSSSTKAQYMFKWNDFGTKTKKYEFYSETLKAQLVGHAADALVAKVMTITLTGTSGTANINIKGTDYLVTFDTSLTKTASNFVTTHAAALLLAKVIVTSVAGQIVLTNSTKGIDFTAIAPITVTGDLAGTIATTTAANVPRWNKTVDELMDSCNYTARGELAFVPHYEPPLRFGNKTDYPLTFIDTKSRFNREGRSQNNPLYYQFKKLDPGDVNWDDIIRINPIDAANLGIKTGDMVKVTSEYNPTTGIKVKAMLYEGVRPGTVAKTFGQGHWAYGRFASKLGANNNEILPAVTERLSGSNARNGGFCGVKIVKV